MGFLADDVVLALSKMTHAPAFFSVIWLLDSQAQVGKPTFFNAQFTIKEAKYSIFGQSLTCFEVIDMPW